MSAPRWILVACLVCLASLANIRATIANSNPSAVVVLPITSTDSSLEIYETATSAALASALRAGGIHGVETASTAGAVQGSTRVIVDGRLIADGNEKVRIEARLREAVTGRVLATVATKAAALTAIDRLVEELAADLVEPLQQAVRSGRSVVRLPTTVVEGARPAVADLDRPSAARVLLVPASGTVANGVLDARITATAAAVEHLRRHGIPFAVADEVAGVVESEPLSAALASSGAALAVMLEVKRVDFDFRGVLLARGAVRVVVVGSDRRTRLDTVVKTATLVGSRGDRHSALIYAVVDQALDIVYPHLRRELGS